MRILVLLVLLFLAVQADRRIVSRPIQSTYNQYGDIDQMIIQWKSSQPIFTNDYIKITLPETIHNGSLSISYSLSTAYSTGIVSNQNSVAYVGSNTYYLPVNANLSASIWY
jgi:hypothetical protein